MGCIIYRDKSAIELTIEYNEIFLGFSKLKIPKIKQVCL